MSDLFDKIFIDRVKDVFGKHQETYHPDDWQKLQAKMNQKKGKIILLWPQIAKAASIILFVGVATFTANKYEKGTTTFTSKENPTIESLNEANNSSDIKQSKTDASAYSAKEETKEKQNTQNTNELKSYKENEISLAVSVNENSHYSDIGNERFSNVKSALQQHHNEIRQMDSISPNIDKPVLKEYNDFIIANEEKAKKRIDVGVELASVSNYSTEGTGNGVNLGGGVAAAYRITDKVSITTGILIAKQSIEYAPENNYEMAYADYAELNSALIADNQNVENVSSSASEISFVAIDIPLNIQLKHKRVSFSTGFSSLLFVQEKYNRTYNAVISNKIYNSTTRNYDVYNSVETVRKEETTEPFQRFDFARLLNLSVGYDIPIAKGGLTVEPYLKYPLGKIGTKEVFMGTGGVALRYNF